MKYILIALTGFVLIFFLIWAHHMFMAGVNPFISNFFVIPFIIIFLASLIYLKKKIEVKSSNSISTLFSIVFLLFLILSALTFTFWGNSAIDLQMHDTYFVVAHFHILVLVSLIFGIYAIAYFVIPKLIKKKLSKTLSETHFWLTTIGVLLFIYLIYNIQVAGLPRSYYNIEKFDAYDQFESMNKAITIIVILLIFFQTIFLANFVYSLLKNTKK